MVIFFNASVGALVRSSRRYGVDKKKAMEYSKRRYIGVSSAPNPNKGHFIKIVCKTEYPQNR
jgi:hypothetical protein